MKNKKNLIIKFWKNKKNKIIIITSVFSLFFLIFLYYFISFVKVSSVDIYIERLRRTYNSEVICREACLASRQEYRDFLISKANKKNKYKEKIEEVIILENENIEFRKDLLLMSKSIYKDDETPLYLIDYFYGEGGNEELKKTIILSYKFINKLSDYYYILTSNFSLTVKRAVMFIISNYEDKKEYSLKDLDIINSLIFDLNTDNKLRQDLVLVLANYHNNYTEKVNSIWSEILISDLLEDEISKVFAADFLDEEIPEISDSEWIDYFTN